nr:hypothetical protein [candidate division Zixibacteria bacterium]
MSRKLLRTLGFPENIPVRWAILHLMIILAIGLGIGGCGGCDGCGCIPDEVDPTPVRASGEAILEIQNLTALGTQGTTQYISVAFTGTIVTPGEGTGDGSFNVNKTYEVTPTNVNPAPSLERKKLKPGTWDMKVTIGNWSQTRRGTIVKNKGTTFTFVYGQ